MLNKPSPDRVNKQHWVNRIAESSAYKMELVDSKTGKSITFRRTYKPRIRAVNRRRLGRKPRDDYDYETDPKRN